MVFTIAQKVNKHLGYFFNKICSQEIPKIVQSGHTGVGRQRRQTHLFHSSSFVSNQMITVKRTHNILHHFSMRIISNADERTLLSEVFLLRCTQRYCHTYPIECWVQYHFFSRYWDFKKMPALKITKVSTPTIYIVPNKAL